MKKRLLIIALASVLSILTVLVAIGCTPEEEEPVEGVAVTFSATLTVGEVEYKFELKTDVDKTFKITCAEDTSYSETGTYVFKNGKGFTFTFSDNSTDRAGFNPSTRIHMTRVPITFKSVKYYVPMTYFDTTSFGIGTDYVHPADENVKYQFYGSASSGPSNFSIYINLKSDGNAVVKNGTAISDYGKYTYDSSTKVFAVTLDDGTELPFAYNSVKDGYALRITVAGFMGNKLTVTTFYSPTGETLVAGDFTF